MNLGNLLLSLSDIMDIAKSNFAQHQHRTTLIAFEIAKKVFSDADRVRDVFTAALLHDIGSYSFGEDECGEPAAADFDSHCIHSEMLLERVSWFKQSAEIIRNQRRPETRREGRDKEASAVSAQIILLSDQIESLVDHDVYILHQNREIVEKAKELAGGGIKREIFDAFMEVAKRDEFWLNLGSQRVYPILLRNSPYKGFEIDLNGVLGISEFVQEVIDFKSPFTATHSTGVSACAEKIAMLYGFQEDDVKLMQIAGSLHDIGKLVIPNRILDKPGKLTAEEFAIIKSHAYYTYYALNTIGGLENIVEWAACHHERPDGNGYPFHYGQEELGFQAKIVAAADVFTAISEDRPYRKGMEEGVVRAFLREQAAGAALDKRIVDMILDNYPEISGHVKDRQIEAQSFYQNYFKKA